MIPSDESFSWNEDCDGHDVLGLFDISDADVDSGWEQFAKTHILPDRLFSLAVGLLEPTAEDTQHLEACNSCRTALAGYRKCDSPASTSSDISEDAPETRSVHAPCLGDEGTSLSSEGSSFCTKALPPTPELIREHLRVESPVVFPGKQVAFESWQFGRITQIARSNPVLAEKLVDTIAEHATSVLLPRLTTHNIVLVCFGRAIHRCGTRMAAMLQDSGHACPHVVLAHDYYDPQLICDSQELHDAQVIALVAVVHSGSTLDKLMSLCKAEHPHSVMGLALIGPGDDHSLCAPWMPVWGEQRDSRLSLEDFLRDASGQQRQQLNRFEPNDECAVSRKDTEADHVLFSRCSDQPEPVDDQLINCIHETNAVKCDYSIGGRRYPYVINVLDLLKSVPSRRYILDLATQKLSDLRDKRVCLVYHSGRSARAGRVARVIGTELGWPTVPVGSRGATFGMTQSQYRKLRCYDTAIVVDAAVRTGDSMSAMAYALRDKSLQTTTKILAFCVLDALTTTSRSDLSEDLGMEIRTLFQLPLAPPTEEVRHWANKQKAILWKQMNENETFGTGVRDVITSYCKPTRANRRSGDDRRSPAQTRACVEDAVSHALSQKDGAKSISRACREGSAKVIRHLSVNEVIHDRTVQDLLVGMMFKPVKPCFKENAGIALAAAGNFDWMTSDWLKCNRPFLASQSGSWRSIVMIAIQMRLDGYSKELKRFRDAAVEYRGRHLSKTGDGEQIEESQMMLFDGSEVSSHRAGGRPRQTPGAEKRLRERLELFIEAAS